MKKPVATIRIYEDGRMTMNNATLGKYNHSLINQRSKHPPKTSIDFIGEMYNASYITELVIDFTPTMNSGEATKRFHKGIQKIKGPRVASG